jgi:hypothetical protein
VCYVVSVRVVPVLIMEDYVLLYKSVPRDKNKKEIKALMSKLADEYNAPQEHHFLHGYRRKGVSTFYSKEARLP